MKKTLLLVLCLTAIISSNAQDGVLDGSFGTGGIVTTSFGTYSVDQANDEVIQVDGKIIAAGFSTDPGTGLENFSLARYNSNGSLDNSFGSNGLVITPTITDFNCEAFAVELQDDGKILVAGSANDTNTTTPQNGYFVVVRYHANGIPDSSFGINGVASIQLQGFLPDAYVSDMLIQPDSAIVVAGGGYINMTDGDMVFMRFTTTGTLDSTFGVAGISVQAPPAGGAFPTAIALQPDGMIVVASLIDAGNHNDPLMTRLTDTGSIDLNFGSAGFIFPTYGFSSAFLGVALQSDGKIVASGFSDSGALIARFYDDGLADLSFYGTGYITCVIGTQNDAMFEDVLVQPDGKIIGAGSAEMKFAMVRVSSTGTPDGTFGTAGVVLTPIPSNFLAGAQAIKLQSDGKIVLAGFAAGFSSTAPGVFALARYTNAPTEVHEWSQIDASVFPNPFHDETAIQFANPNHCPANLKLYDCTGRLVRVYEDYTTDRIVISGIGLEAGVYNWSLEIEGEKRETGKIILR